MTTTKLSAAVTKSHPIGSMKVLDVVIIGGGLSGVLVSHGLQQQQQQAPVDWRLLEARNVLGSTTQTHCVECPQLSSFRL